MPTEKSSTQFLFDEEYRISLSTKDEWTYGRFSNLAKENFGSAMGPRTRLEREPECTSRPEREEPSFPSGTLSRSHRSNGHLAKRTTVPRGRKLHIYWTERAYCKHSKTTQKILTGMEMS